ncbi:TatD family hydrolase [Paludicola sp. MB14-C6]|uniref:TatD family hydrolase n=1 Tax=Paludihabitans sp. MB14-C6 TaxID=3070656 RepID=UPI0027DCE780|nr:TatD family hydrolase [Paludicola sp. MB14-C6]WMJ23505.1 TatD family hydrolase [Paludicola sp. MB14-C6]
MQGIFDSHAHYDDERFEEDLEQVLQFIQDNGVTNIINVGCNIERSRECIALAKKYQFIYAAVGVHPHDSAEVDDGYIDEIDKMLHEDKVVALGEIGLDYHYDFSPRDVQKRVFEEQLQLAKAKDVPVIIHSREAVQDTMELLNQYQPKGVVHCFTGSAETAKECLKLGLYIGFTGVVTFPNARKTLEVIAATPLERILLETDCPYMAPVPFRGKRTTSDMIEKTADVIASIKNVSTQELIDIARVNTIRLFLQPE